MQVGDKVKIVLNDNDPLYGTVWWPKGQVTGVVQKIFKNGKVMVAIDQLPNRSDDGKSSMNFPANELQII